MQDPIHHGFHPDPPISRAGSNFYIVDSTTNGFPVCRSGLMLDAAGISDEHRGKPRIAGAVAGICAQDLGVNRLITNFEYFQWSQNP